MLGTWTGGTEKIIEVNVYSSIIYFYIYSNNMWKIILSNQLCLLFFTF